MLFRVELSSFEILSFQFSIGHSMNLLFTRVFDPVTQGVEIVEATLDQVSKDHVFTDQVSSLAGQIARRLAEVRVSMAAEFASHARVRTCVIDNVLPDAFLRDAFAGMPPLQKMVRREGRRERKYVSSNINTFSPDLTALVLAFNDPRVAAEMSAITGLSDLEADAALYNGGVTSMEPSDFMCPHLDNSHDYGRTRSRRIVALFYLTPGWQRSLGGHLGVWDDPRGPAPRELEYRFNRLVLMETTDRSWHSVAPIVGDRNRTNITCYYYQKRSRPEPVRVTRFRAWPKKPVDSLVFGLDFALRSMASRFVGRRLARNAHVYDEKS